MGLFCTPSCLPTGFHLFSTHPAWIRPYHLLLESILRAHLLFRARGAHPASAWSAGGWPSQTHKWSCLPPSPVPCPGATRRCTALLCYAGCAPMKPAAHSGPAASFPAPVDTVQGRCKERSRCRWEPCACASSLAARTSSRLCRRKSTRTVTLLAVHAADAYEEECDGSFHARHHRRCYGAQGFLLLHHTMND